MTTAARPKTSIYVTAAEAECLREVAAELGLLQVGGGGVRYQAGSLSALLRFLAARSRTRHRSAIIEFLRALQVATVRDG